MPEDERRAILESLEAQHPGASALVAGTLAGPATPGRPDVPIWDYQRFADEHPDVDLNDLIAVRFPVVFFDGEETTITSAEEYLSFGPKQSDTKLSLNSVLDLWARLHAARVVQWNSDRRRVEHVRPFDAYCAVVAEWRLAHQLD